MHYQNTAIDGIRGIEVREVTRKLGGRRLLWSDDGNIGLAGVKSRVMLDDAVSSAAEL